MGRASTWNNRATTPLRIPKVFVKVGNCLFRGLDTFTVNSEKNSERLQVKLSSNDIGGQCDYLIEMLITRLPRTEEQARTNDRDDTAIKVSNCIPTEAIEQAITIFGGLEPEDFKDSQPDAISHSEPDAREELNPTKMVQIAVQPDLTNVSETSETKSITGNTVNIFSGTTEESLPLIEVTETVLNTFETLREPEPGTQPSRQPTAGVTASNSGEFIEEEFVLPVFNLTEFGNQIYDGWQRIAKATQLPVWGCPVDLDDLYRQSFSSMQGNLFLKRVHQLIEQEASQKVMRIGLINIPGKQPLSVGTQQGCALTFWHDWHQTTTEIDPNDQPAKMFLSDPAVIEVFPPSAQQEILAPGALAPTSILMTEVETKAEAQTEEINQGRRLQTEQVAELQRLRNLLEQLPEPHSAKNEPVPTIPTTTTLERLRAEREQHLREIQQRHFGQNHRTISTPKTRFAAGFMRLLQGKQLSQS